MTKTFCIDDFEYESKTVGDYALATVVGRLEDCSDISYFHDCDGLQIYDAGDDGEINAKSIYIKACWTDFEKFFDSWEDFEKDFVNSSEFDKLEDKIYSNAE